MAESVAGQAVSEPTQFKFSTGGPSIVRAYPQPAGGSAIEEEQFFVFLLNGQATTASIKKNGYCEVTGIGERLGLKVVAGQTAMRSSRRWTSCRNSRAR